MTVRPASPQRCRLGAAIRERRRAIGLSQEDLAELIDCHRNYVGTIERGEQNITFDLLIRFAKALDTSLVKICMAAKL
ncbi:MAG: helix-turn-helix transcriptional regulator [bacterium]